MAFALVDQQRFPVRSEIDRDKEIDPVSEMGEFRLCQDKSEIDLVEELEILIGPVSEMEEFRLCRDKSETDPVAG